MNEYSCNQNMGLSSTLLCQYDKHCSITQYIILHEKLRQTEVGCCHQSLFSQKQGLCLQRISLLESNVSIYVDMYSKEHHKVLNDKLIAD